MNDNPPPPQLSRNSGEASEPLGEGTVVVDDGGGVDGGGVDGVGGQYVDFGQKGGHFPQARPNPQPLLLLFVQQRSKFDQNTT